MFGFDASSGVIDNFGALALGVTESMNVVDRPYVSIAAQLSTQKGIVEMNAKSHRTVNDKIFDLLATLDPHGTNWLCIHRSEIVTQAVATDDFLDLEFVDVEGFVAGADHLDDPHRDETSEDDDSPSYSEEGRIFTAFNHFMDIKKGPGLFDDFDGYSYHRGSACHDEFQEAADADGSIFQKIVAKISGLMVDEGVMWWFNDNYVHAPGHRWYRDCSPSIERYSFPGDKGIYSSVEEEARARFPVADWVGKKNMGVPYSVFMPLDNMARYWWERFERTLDPRCLGPLMHAVQDASIPHHAAGYMGNWHQTYEDQIDSRIAYWLNDQRLITSAIDLYRAWNRDDAAPPSVLQSGDHARAPARNWRVDMLTTWLALTAYQSYDRTYQHFRHGFRFDDEDARLLTTKAMAICLLVLSNAGQIPFHNPLPTGSVVVSLHKAGKTLPFSWRSDLPRYPSSLRGVINLLNSMFPTWPTTPFP